MTSSQFARKISVFGYFGVAVTLILFPPLGAALIIVLFGRKAWQAYQAAKERRAFERHIDQAMAVANAPQDAPPRAAGYLPRIVVDNTQDAGR